MSYAAQSLSPQASLEGQTSRYTSANTRRMQPCTCWSLKSSTYAAVERFEELVLVGCAIVPPLNLS